MKEATRARLGRLIPRLGTTHAGEVIATVEAIKRTLQAEGCDLHDLAKHLTGAPAPIAIEADRPWADAVLNLLQEHADCSACLSEWEKGFLGKLLGYHTCDPSEKQLIVLGRIERKAATLHAL